MKNQTVEIPDGLDVGREKKRGVRMNPRRLKFWARVTGRMELLPTKMGQVVAAASVVGKSAQLKMCEFECKLNNQVNMMSRILDTQVWSSEWRTGLRILILESSACG